MSTSRLPSLPRKIRRPSLHREAHFGRYTPPARARKKLNIPTEDFFLVCLLALGPPDSEMVAYQGKTVDSLGRVPHGTYGWLIETEEGQLFERLVLEHGDAKARAHIIAKAWYYWHKEKLRVNRIAEGIKSVERAHRQG